MPSRPVVAVADATGVLGNAVARAILNDPQQPLQLRALVRTPGAPAAQALAQGGAEVVATDLDCTHAVLRALRGTHTLFAVTDFWEHGSPERELSQARAMATAARLADVAHVIWATQEDSRDWISLDDPRMPTLLQFYKVPPFDAKGAADAIFEASGIPTTFLRSALSWEQLLAMGLGPRRAEDGGLHLALPIGERLLPGIALSDIGMAVRSLVLEGAPPASRTIGLAGDHLTGRELALAFQRALHESVVFDAVPFDCWRSLGIPGAEEQANMFQFIHDFNAPYAAARPVETARALHPATQRFDDWLATHRAYIPTL